MERHICRLFCLQSLFEMAYNDEQMRGDVMLEKNILEDVLEIACSTTGDFAEIFEEVNYSTRISMLNDEVESTNSGIRCGWVCGFIMDWNPCTAIPMIQMKKI